MLVIYQLYEVIFNLSKLIIKSSKFRFNLSLLLRAVIFIYTSFRVKGMEEFNIKI